MDSKNDIYADKPLVWKTRDIHYLNDDVQLKQATLDIHVINDKNRKELIGEEETLRSVVTEPSYIWKDKKHDTRINYGGVRRLTGSSKLRWIKITVDTAENPADICTVIAQSRLENFDEKDTLYDSTKTDTF